MSRFILLAHRYTGIVLAAYAALMGLTGAALLWHEEAALGFRAPDAIDLGGRALDADQVSDRVRQAFPDWHMQTLWWPDREHQPPWFAEIRRGTVGTIGETALGVYVHPQTGAILYTHNYSQSVWRWMQLLHFNLLVGRNGRVANGILALATLFAALTGVLLWWRSRLWWTTVRSRRRRSWEWHQVVGIYAMPWLLVACLTGSYFAWRAEVHRAIAPSCRRSS